MQVKNIICIFAVSNLKQMELNIRTESGLLTHTIKGHSAISFYDLLNASRKSFTKSTKTFNSDKNKPYISFIATDDTKLMIASEFEIWVHKNWYIIVK